MSLTTAPYAGARRAVVHEAFLHDGVVAVHRNDSDPADVLRGGCEAGEATPSSSFLCVSDLGNKLGASGMLSHAGEDSGVPLLTAKRASQRRRTGRSLPASPTDYDPPWNVLVADPVVVVREPRYGSRPFRRRRSSGRSRRPRRGRGSCRPPRRPMVRRRYFGAADLVEALYRGMADNTVAKIIDTLLRADLVIVDELGFAPLDLVGTQLLFRFVAAAYERRSSASPATGPSTPGVGSCPNTPPPPPCSTGSCTKPSSSSPKATATASAKPRQPEDAARSRAEIDNPRWGPSVGTNGDLA